MNAEKKFLRQLADSDIDDLMDQAGRLPRAKREQRVRETLELIATIRDPILLVKAVGWIQAALAGFDSDDLALPVPLAVDLVARLTQTVRSRSAPVEARESALTGIALVFIKVNVLPNSLDAAIRRAFRSATKDSDKQLREFAKRSLGAHGVLSRRHPTRHLVALEHLRLPKVINTIASLEGFMKINKGGKGARELVAQRVQKDLRPALKY
ncbi:MAG TPA: hypothetical protein VEZ11_17495 [Thermoanaerobaculia bacterium]|nr:hypothetical protein [Thermoanaerobaculia bacterium]